MKRSAGILLPIYALPQDYGFGTLGTEAYNFVDWLVEAGQTWWQMLPIGPTGGGDSPYQSLSSFAGNPYFIDLQTLVEEGLLTEAECSRTEMGDDPSLSDYGLIDANRRALIHKAFERDRESRDYLRFREDLPDGLYDYAMYMALRLHFGGTPWTAWDEDIRQRRPESMERYGRELSDDIEFYLYMQYHFFRQWYALKSYAERNGVFLMGDVPIYVPLDSADVWAGQHFFQLDERNLPTAVAGVPPDYFNEDGQLWGNPLYNWEAMRDDGYSWWIRRFGCALRLFDMVRIDHFRGLASYWSVPAGETTARNGRWLPGPGMEFLGRMINWFGKDKFVAEDLGILTEDVQRLLDESGLPGMKVLEFAFDPRENSNALPHWHRQRSVCLIGTHDNAPVLGWAETADPKEVSFAKEYLHITGEEGLNWGFIRGGMASVADLFVTQIQDYLGLGNEARTNVPGTPTGNWRWRLVPGQLTEELAEKIRRITKLYGRL